METLTLSAWNEFVDIAHTHDGWAFRGQRDARWPLFSSLSRYLRQFKPNLASWQESEERAVRVFRRKAHNYLTDLRILDNDLRCLALMQHHGAPTRLIDFTKSPYVAAFFALEHATDTAAVFALNTPALWSAAPTAAPDFTRDRIDPRKNGNYGDLFAPNVHEMLWTGEPKEMDHRLVAQSGTFVVPGVLDKSIEEILQSYNTREPLIKKCILPVASIRPEAVKSLYKANITNATLFPDLDGLAKSVAIELEINWKGTITGNRSLH